MGVRFEDAERGAWMGEKADEAVLPTRARKIGSTSPEFRISS